MTAASCLPSSSLGVGGVARLAPSSVTWNPRSTRLWRTFSTVLIRHPNASAIRASVHAGPSASALSRTWARRTFWPVPLSFFTTSASVDRSASDSRTTYFFTTELSLLSTVMASTAARRGRRRYPNL